MISSDAEVWRQNNVNSPIGEAFAPQPTFYVRCEPDEAAPTRFNLNDVSRLFHGAGEIARQLALELGEIAGDHAEIEARKDRLLRLAVEQEGEGRFDQRRAVPSLAESLEILGAHTSPHAAFRHSPVRQPRRSAKVPPALVTMIALSLIDPAAISAPLSRLRRDRNGH